MPANASVAVATPDVEMVFRPFEDSDLNGMWLYDNEFPETECKNDRERRGYRQAANADAEYEWCKAVAA